MQGLQLLTQSIFILLPLLSPPPVISAPVQPPNLNDPSDAQSQSIVSLALRTYNDNTIALLRTSNTTCNQRTVSIRRAWDDISTQDRTNFINAVKCMTRLPSRTDPVLAPGARTLHDDYVYAHINQTNYIHQSSLLLPWHRQFIWAYEHALRTECNYTGTLPYWPWERHSSNQSLSPVFDDSPTSFGGNGIPIPHPAANPSTIGIDPPFFIPRPPGTGGGCITTGAFTSHRAHLGPVDPTTQPPSNPWGTAYNPRCLTRDFLQPASTANLTYAALAALYTTTSIHDFHPLLEFGIHANSHGFVGGEANDFYSSPNDPLFYLLHAQIDRVWTVWQGGDVAGRTSALDGTVTFLNRPPSENGTVDTMMWMGEVAGGRMRVGEAMDVLGGEYCYMYV